MKNNCFQSLPTEESKSQQGEDLLITPFINAGQLPELLEEGLQVVNQPQMRDMLLLSMLTNCGYALPQMRFLHGKPRHEYGPELMTMVLAPAASGKGIMNYGRRMMRPIENYNHGEVYIPANTSASALIATLHDFSGKAIMMATEMDTLSRAIRSSYGQFSDIIRCAFEHEPIGMVRRTDNEFIEIRHPRLTMLLSGTQNQLHPFISSRENGLTSRFACYLVTSRADFQDEVWDADDDSLYDGSEVAVFESIGEKLLERYQWMRNASHKCMFCLTDSQRQSVKRMFRSEYDNYSGEYAEEFDQTLKRLPIIMKRVGMILTSLRLDISKPLPEKVFCSDQDFETMLLIGHKLLMHAAMMFCLIPETKSKTPQPVSGSMLSRQFFDMLPAEFQKNLAVAQANTLGVSVKTVNNWLLDWTQKSKIEHVAHGSYKKRA